MSLIAASLLLLAGEAGPRTVDTDWVFAARVTVRVNEAGDQ